MSAPLTLDQDKAIRQYAKEHGKNWKAALRTDWMRSGDDSLFTGDWTLLQQVRNQKGPSWLIGFTL